jgi:hypothetical protein
LRVLIPAALVATSLILVSSPAQAATINVSTLSDVASNTECTLRKAIESAVTNATAPTSDCAAGQAGTVDIISLGSLNGEYDISTKLVISPADMGGLEIRGNLDGSGQPLDKIGYAGTAGTDRVMEISGKVTLDSVAVEDGRGFDAPGILVNQFATVKFKNAVVRNNRALTVIGGNLGAGGALVALFGANVTIEDSTIGGTSAADANVARVGGGISSSADLTITRSAIIGNSASMPADGGSADALVGGGLSLSGGTSTIVDSTIASNSVDALEVQDGQRGAGINIENATVTVRNTTISDNTISSGGSNGEAAGLSVTGGVLSTVAVVNSTIANNTIQAGAGSRSLSAILYSTQAGSSLRLNHTTVSGNTPTTNAILGNAEIVARGSIINQGANACFGSGLTANAFNWDAGSSCVGFAADTDIPNGTNLGLDPLTDNGGPTQTMALISGSEAINAVPSAECDDLNGSPLTTDQRGSLRPADGACEIGAFEVFVAPPTPTPTDPPGVAAFCNGLPANIVGTAGADSLTGTPANDVIAAGDGNDVVLGGGGNDIICGGNGNDVLKGQGGNDKLLGEAGADKLRGGAGKKDLCKGGPAVDNARKCEKVRSL